MQTDRKIMILGRSKDTSNYERFLLANKWTPITTLDPEYVSSCTGLILPGGGDITPAFFGEKNSGSKNIDTELDILQFQAFELCLKYKLPVLGICKGMQLINIALGGTVVQDMPQKALHTSCSDGDLYHPTHLLEADSLLYRLYGEEALVNSAHHQCLGRIGDGLLVIQRSRPDDCPEAIIHKTLPILGLQWHPERLDPTRTTLSGAKLLAFFSQGLSS